MEKIFVTLRQVRKDFLKKIQRKKERKERKGKERKRKRERKEKEGRKKGKEERGRKGEKENKRISSKFTIFQRILLRKQATDQEKNTFRSYM